MTRRKLNTIFLFAIAGLFSLVSVGYAALSQNLMITGDMAYLYDNLLYDVLKNEAKRGGLAEEYTGNHGDSIAGTGNKEIYHWYAENDQDGLEILNKNNVIFAGQCWQMIRTTDTGGVKMIYNGEEENNQCLSTRGTHPGYDSGMNTPFSAENGYFYGTDFSYNSSSHTFSLEGTITQTDWNSTSAQALIGQYTCLSNNNDTCSELYLVNEYVNDTTGYGIKIINNSPYSQFGKVRFNQSMFASISNVGYMHNKTYEVGIMEYASGIIFGNGFTYSNGTYTLTNTSSTLDSTHHYTCNNSTGSCSELKYIYAPWDNESSYAISLSDGKSVEDALSEMLNSNDINLNDSTIKKATDIWFEKYLSPFSSYLEDTIYCNNRSVSSLGGWNPNGGQITQYLQLKEYNPTTDLSCENNTDKFSTSNNSAKLTYPVGIMSVPEMNLLNNNNARDTAQSYWLLSPSGFSDNMAEEKIVNSSGSIVRSIMSVTQGLRPAISLKENTRFSAGNGSMESPYIISSIKPSYPTYEDSEIVNGVKNVTITYPSGCGSTYICKYQKNNEQEVSVTTDTVIVPFTTSGVLKASVALGDIVVSNNHRVTYNELYVKSDGNDSTGSGTIAAPYKTIRKAYEMSDNGSTIYIMDNITQNDTLNLSNNKVTVIKSCTKANDTSCPTGVANTITRGNSLSNKMINLANGTLTLETIKLDGNNVSSTEAILYSKGNLYLNAGTTITKANNTNDGGAIYNDDGLVEVTQATITNNNANKGAGIFNKKGTMIIHSGTLSNNHVAVTGGAIWGNGVMRIDDGLISNNSSDYAAAGINVSYIENDYAQMTINGGTISGNTAANSGGGIYVNGTADTDTSLIITGGTITNNSAQNNGGGIFNVNSLTISGGTISENNAVEKGGGIYQSELGTLEMSNGLITENEVTSQTSSGGGIYALGSVEISNGSITDNIADKFAGGLLCGGNCTMSGGTITGNTATTDHGGGLRVEGTFYMSELGGTIQNNSAPTCDVTNNISVKENVGASFYDSRSEHIHNHSVYYIANALDNNYVADLAHSQIHGNILIYQNGSNTNQKWKTLPAKVINGVVYYVMENKIRNSSDQSQVMSVASSSSTPGSNILGWEFGDYPGRYYSLEKAGSSYYYIKNINNLCVNVANGTAVNEQNVQADTCDESTSEKWRFIDSSGVSKYTIQFNGNGNTGGSTASVICTVGQNCTLTTNGFTKTNHKFIGWATSTTGDVAYTNGQSVYNLSTTAGTTVNLYAVWRDSTKIYVSSSGNDSTGYGTIANPYATIAKAYTEAATSATIYMMSNITQSAAATMGNAKTITLTSCTKSSNTACAYSTAYSLTRKNTFTNDYMIKQTQGTLNLTNIKLNGNSTSSSGGLISSSATLNVKSGATLTNAKSTSYGGAINTSGTLTVSGGTISSNTADRGGGIYASSTTSTVNLSSGSITSNTATNSSSSGGGIFSYGTINITGGTISNNTAEATGGGVWVAKKLTMSAGTITNNTAGGAGGGITITYQTSSASVATISGGTISNNTAGASGGGIFVHSSSSLKSTLTYSVATISGNTADNLGGGIYSSTDSTTTINSGTITNNTATTSSGGGIASEGTLKITGGSITKNTGHVRGGGVWARGSFTMSGGTIGGINAANKTETGAGGGVYIKSGTGTFSGGTISYNTAKTYGGGIFIDSGSTSTMASTTIASNTATSNDGGGICLSGTFTLNGSSVISSNKAPNGKGGGVNVTSTGSFTQNGSIIKKNTAGTDGGISVTSGGTYSRPNSSGYVCKNNSPTNTYDTTATSNTNCS